MKASQDIEPAALADDLDNAAELLAALLSHARGGEIPAAELEQEVDAAIRALRCHLAKIRASALLLNDVPTGDRETVH